MIKRCEDLQIEKIEGLKNGKGTVEFQHIIHGEELKGKGRLFTKATIPVGGSIGTHDHTTDFEVYYILSGKGIVYEGDKSTEVNKGDVVYTSDGQEHNIENIGCTPLVFLAVVLYA